MDILYDKQKMAPLADRMRPVVLNEFIGQEHILSKGSLLYRAIQSNGVGSCIFWGPPGVGKTTLANVMANSTDSHFEKLNAVLSGVKDAKMIIEQAIERFERTGKRTYLLLDECHRWNKAQSDCVLQAIEKGYIIFIGSTTENPYVAMTPAIVSRCRVFEFKPLSVDNVRTGILRAINSPKGLAPYNVSIDDDAVDVFVDIASGDIRSGYNALEFATLTTPPQQDGVIHITKQIALDSSQRKALSVDKNTYYDMISAFIKSMRGSDANAASFWFMRLLNAGVDPLLLARRIVIHASEDVGLADSNALVVATSALTAFTHLGLPEGRIPLMHAILYICNAPKSNSVVDTIAGAEEDALNNPKAKVPDYLCSSSYPHSNGVKLGSGYKYPHEYEGGWVQQQYLPDELKDKVYYNPKHIGDDNGFKGNQQG
ncbi:MAG: replication-associated recombination protein A [Clostridia bacterium]|nr:replication-associated recombination protein A [Clostridia bacterium]